MDFLEWKYLNFDSNFLEISSQGSNCQNVSIGSDNGLAPNRRQAIFWTINGLCCRRIYASLDLNECKSLGHGRCSNIFKYVILKYIVVSEIQYSSYETASS